MIDMTDAVRRWAEDASPALGVSVDRAERAAWALMNAEREPLKVFGVLMPPKPRWWRWRQRQAWRAEVKRRAAAVRP